MSSDHEHVLADIRSYCDKLVSDTPGVASVAVVIDWHGETDAPLGAWAVSQKTAAIDTPLRLATRLSKFLVQLQTTFADAISAAAADQGASRQ